MSFTESERLTNGTRTYHQRVTLFLSNHGGHQKRGTPINTQHRTVKRWTLLLARVRLGIENSNMAHIYYEATTFLLGYRTVVRSVLSVCGVGVLWPNGWMDQDGTWQAGRPRPRSHCIRWRPSSLFPKDAQPAHFRPMSTVAKRRCASGYHLVRK